MQRVGIKKNFLLGVMQPEFEEHCCSAFFTLKINLVLKTIQQILNSYSLCTVLGIIHRTGNKIQSANREFILVNYKC